MNAVGPGGVNLHPFHPTTGPGYVWHCHVLDHEDNDMMWPYSWLGDLVLRRLAVQSAASAFSTGSGSVPVQGCSATSNRMPSGP